MGGADVCVDCTGVGAGRAPRTNATRTYGKVLVPALYVNQTCAAPGSPIDRHLTKWRRLRDEGGLEALSRPQESKPAPAFEVENAHLRRRLAEAEAELEKARTVIEVQGNVSALLGQLSEPKGANADKRAPPDD